MIAGLDLVDDGDNTASMIVFLDTMTKPTEWMISSGMFIQEIRLRGVMGQSVTFSTISL